MTTGKKLSHLDARGRAQMVEVGHKPVQLRGATAEGVIRCLPATIRLLRKSALPKGDVLTVAKIAAIQAAKRTAELIPLCHPLPLSGIQVDFKIQRNAIAITSTVRTTGQTGVEMEALAAVSVAALTIYDMCKAVDAGMVIGDIRLVSKIKQ